MTIGATEINRCSPDGGMLRCEGESELTQFYKATALVATLMIAALLTPAVAAAGPTPPELPGCTTVIGERQHPYYGHGWLARCEDGVAFVVPTNNHHWAIVYAAFSDLPYVEPAWVEDLLQQAFVKGT